MTSIRGKDLHVPLWEAQFNTSQLPFWPHLLQGPWFNSFTCFSTSHERNHTVVVVVVSLIELDFFFSELFFRDSFILLHIAPKIDDRCCFTDYDSSMILL